jgi:hypothetical protein
MIKEITLMDDLLVEVLKNRIAQEKDFKQRQLDTRKIVGKCLTDVRIARKLSFREAGELIGCDPGLLNRIEKGKAWAYTVVEKALAVYSQPAVPVVEPTVETSDTVSV